MMSLRYGVLCLLLVFVVLLLSLKNYETWTRPVKFIPEKDATKKSGTKIEGSPSVVGQKEPTNIEAYILIAEKNIFSPERKEFPIIKPPTGGPGGPMGPNGQPVKPPPVRPKIILYGVTIQGQYQAASLANPGRPLQKGERETYTVKLGDRIGEYKLAKVSPDRISLEAEGDSFEVLLYDSTTPKKRMDVRTEIKPAAVTSTQPTPAAPVPGSIPAGSLPIPAGTPKAVPPGGTIVPTPQQPQPPTPTTPTYSRPGRTRTTPNPPAGAPTQ
jgi:hypothetical protein